MKQLIHEYEPLGSARELFMSREPEVLLSGAAGTGKSRGCLEKIHTMCMLEQNAGMRVLILRKTAVSLTSTTLVTFKEHVAKEALQSGEVKFFGGSPQEAPGYKYSNGSTITIGGMDKATRIMSSEYDLIYVAEAIELTEDDWEAASTRLRNGKVSFQQIIADTNPSSPHHWLKQRCDSGRTKIIYCRHEDNPVLYDAVSGTWTDAGKAYIDRLDNLSGVRHERLRLGKWAAADGLIYDTFDPAIHLRPSMVMPPPAWSRYWAIDFGYNNPTVVQFWCETPDGQLILYRELYMTQRTVEDHCVTIDKMRHTKAGLDPLPTAVITDHDAEGRVVMERKLGVTTTAAHKSVLEGIDTVKQRLRVKGDGKPGLTICRDALYERDQSLADARKTLCTEQEMLEYVWGSGTTKEAPLKQNDHGMDAMRYMVAFKDLIGRPNIRVVGEQRVKPPQEMRADREAQLQRDKDRDKRREERNKVRRARMFNDESMWK